MNLWDILTSPLLVLLAHACCCHKLCVREACYHPAIAAWRDTCILFWSWSILDLDPHRRPLDHSGAVPSLEGVKNLWDNASSKSQPLESWHLPFPYQVDSYKLHMLEVFSSRSPAWLSRHDSQLAVFLTWLVLLSVSWFLIVCFLFLGHFSPNEIKNHLYNWSYSGFTSLWKTQIFRVPSV